MRRRINYTGRHRIKKKDISISITEEEGLHKFYADLNLEDYELPPKARVWMEAYDKNAIMRFPFGTVDALAAEKPTLLEGFAGSDNYYFRVKVVDEKHYSKLLAAANSISPFRQDEEDGTGKSLLRVTIAELGSIPWNLRFESGDYPVLEINNEIDTGSSLARSDPFFQALVFPEVLRRILRTILIENNYQLGSDPDGDDIWMEGWLEFAGSLPGNRRLNSGEELSDDQKENWIEDSVEMFCKQQGSLRKLKVALKEGL